MIMTMTSPDDNLFIAKVALEEQNSSANNVMFGSHQIWYSDNSSGRMIKNLIGYAEHNGVSFDTLNFSGETFLITPSGQIINYD